MLRRMRTTRGKFVVVILPMIIACTLLASVISGLSNQRELRDRLVREMETVAAAQALAVRTPLWAFETRALQGILEAMLTNPDIAVAEVWDERGGSLSRAARAEIRGEAWTVRVPVHGPSLEGKAPELIGELGLTFVDGRIREAVRQQLLRDVLFLLVVIATTTGSAVVAHTLTIGRPLGAFLQAIHRAEDPRRRQPVPVSSEDEIGTIMAAYNRLLAKLAAEEAEHTRANGDLRQARDRAQQALADLRATQHSLIQAEKMASLGQMVAGVAHEINTPVGIALTAASHLLGETRSLERALASNQLRKADLEEYTQATLDAAALLQSNMQRAAALIQSFKQVSVDRSNDQRRPFDLRAYVDEVMLSLGPRLKRTPHKVVLQGEASLPVDTYPGAIAQLLTNLVINALLHAFDDGRTGTMTIELARFPDGLVELRFSDDGKGIPPHYLNRVFEPFFTTKRGSGGSGLGMHICFNLVTRTLGGALMVESAEGHGTTFIARFPARAPADALAEGEPLPG